MIFYVVFRFLDVVVDQMEKNNWVIPTASSTRSRPASCRFMFLGIALMLLMVFRPQGILGDQRELELGDR